MDYNDLPHAVNNPAKAHMMIVRATLPPPSAAPRGITNIPEPET